MARVQMHALCRNYRFSVNGGVKRNLSEMLVVRLASTCKVFSGQVFFQSNVCIQQINGEIAVL